MDWEWGKVPRVWPAVATRVTRTLLDKQPVEGWMEKIAANPKKEKATTIYETKAIERRKTWRKRGKRG